MDNTVLVSVCCITFNQEELIRQCLDSIFMQKTNFKFEVIVHDDASFDSTASIIREYQAKYENLVPILQTENQYSKGKGILIPFLYPIAKGKYIALCEGDDYWTDPYKLQKQFDLMEANEDVSMCFHDALVINAEGNPVKECDARYKKNQYASFKDLILEGGWFCPTASLFFRTKFVLNGYPDFCRNCHVGDYPLQLYLGAVGRVFYFAEKMSVYRFNIPGSWTSKSYGRITQTQVQSWISELEMLDGINRITRKSYEKYILARKADFIILNILYQNKKHINFLKGELKSCVEELSYFNQLLIKSMHDSQSKLFSYFFFHFYKMKKEIRKLTFSIN